MVVTVDHIGSTSITGMPAKPIIDVDITLHSKSDIFRASAILAEQGYEPRGNRYNDDMWAFLLRAFEPNQRIYLCAADNETHHRRLLFRDYLRHHKDVAKAYALLKEQLASRFPFDGDRYTAEKSSFINEIVERARHSKA